MKFGNTLFRNGDKIMQTRNDYDVEWRKGAELSHGIFNGDIGLIRTADKVNNRLEIDFDGRQGYLRRGDDEEDRARLCGDDT